MALAHDGSLVAESRIGSAPGAVRAFTDRAPVPFWRARLGEPLVAFATGG